MINQNQLAPTYQEFPHLLAGSVGLKKWDFKVFNVNPPLPQIIAALPIVLKKKESIYVPPKVFGHRIEHEAVTINIYNNKLYSIKDLRESRLFLSICFFLVISYVFYFFFTSNFSPSIALLLWITCPYFLAFAPLVSPDIPSASAGLLAVYFFHRWLRRSELLEAVIAGIVLGLAELTKFTLLIFYPLFVILWIIYHLPDLFSVVKNGYLKQSGHIIVIFVTSLFIINMGYFFENTGKQLGTFKFQTTLLTGHENLKDVPIDGGNRFKNSILSKFPVPLPANFIQGIDTQRLDFERGLQSYLRGEWSDHGWWYYYLYALLLKLPLGTILLFVLAVFCTIFVREINAPWRDEIVIILPGIVLLFFVSSQTGFSVHSRYVIPALPFFFIWVSKLSKLFLLRKRILSIIVTILLVWSTLSSLLIYPHSISYFNELSTLIPTPSESYFLREPRGSSFFVTLINAGARNGGRHLLDSNIDWGQDLFYLEKWCKQHPEVNEIHVRLSGSYPVNLTDIPVSKEIFNENNLNGWFAISINYLYVQDKMYQQFRNRQPIDRIGYSIYIYYIPE
ncbi:MAG: glycosyltransferase family 39 protein [Planctomycetaceae bacterium]|nr:glycosyltransferase family 39 protein [Planctomycetaceae bacterium]